MHNILKKTQQEVTRQIKQNEGSCNCRRKGECPLGRQYNSKNIAYQVYISLMEHNNDGERIYIGYSAGNWKQGLYNHRLSFSSLQLSNQTALSKYFWNLKDQALTP